MSFQAVFVGIFISATGTEGIQLKQIAPSHCLTTITFIEFEMTEMVKQMNKTAAKTNNEKKEPEYLEFRQ